MDENEGKMFYADEEQLLFVLTGELYNLINDSAFDADYRKEAMEIARGLIADRAIADDFQGTVMLLVDKLLGSKRRRIKGLVEALAELEGL